MAFRKMRNTVEDDQPAETEVEAEIREFVRRDVVTNRERQPENESEMVASSINSVLQRATTASVQEIDKLITELQTLRHMLHSSTSHRTGARSTSQWAKEREARKPHPRLLATRRHLT